MSRQELIAERFIDRLLSRVLHKGQLIVTYPSGKQKAYGDKSRPVKVTIKSLPLGKLRNPPLFIGESYMSGNIEIAEDQLDAFFGLMGQNHADPASLKLLEKFQKRQANLKKRQQKQVSHHYDIGNDYYRLWL